MFEGSDSASVLTRDRPSLGNESRAETDLRRTVQAVEEERRRWARELHDETLQSFCALRLALASARRSNDPRAWRAAIDRGVMQLGEEIKNLRSLITELRPAVLNELGLGPALDALFERVRTEHRLELSARVTLGSGGPLRGGPERDAEATVYRVVQESLTNVVRHARAATVEVEVLETAGQIEVAIRDDGRGFDPNDPLSGLGLTGMRERVELAGGWLVITSSDKGTAVRAGIPAARGTRRFP